MMATLQNFMKTRIRHQSPLFGKDPIQATTPKKPFVTANDSRVIGGSSMTLVLVMTGSSHAIV
jgi:hypothetical protein